MTTLDEVDVDDDLTLDIGMVEVDVVVVGIGMIGWEVEAAATAAAAAAAWAPDPKSAWTLFVNCSNSDCGTLSCQSRYPHISRSIWLISRRENIP